MSIIPTLQWRFLIAVLNSTVSLWIARSTFTSKQGGFFEFTQQFVSQLPIPKADKWQTASVDILIDAIAAGGSAIVRLESLLNAFVYELFFPEELASRGLSPFAAAREAGLDKLAGLEGGALARAADLWSVQIADPSTKLYATLFDLQSIDEIRIIEGRG